MTALTLGEAVPLGYALVAGVASDLGVRALAIKGPTASQQGLRTDRESVDVDILVEPAGFARMVARLEEIGWARQQEPRRSAVLVRHSATLRHRAWPCEFDIHNYYPGFLAAPHVVFEAFWRTRESASLAGRAVPAASTVTNAAILAVHAMRDETSGQSQDPYLDLVEHAKGLGEEQKSDLARLAAETGAARPLAAFLDAVGAPRVENAAPEEEAAARDWDLLPVGAEVTGVASLVELRRSKPWKWPGIVWRVFMLDARELYATDEVGRPGVVGLWTARIRRLRRGITGLPAALRAIRRTSDDRRQ